MNTRDALAFLQRHQPMPSDTDISEDEGKVFAAVLAHFEAHPDERCIPLLIGSVSKETGLGMYEHIRFVLHAHPVEKVEPHLSAALLGTEPGSLYRCCWWALDLNLWKMEPLIRPLLVHPDPDVQYAAHAFIEFLPVAPAQ